MIDPHAAQDSTSISQIYDLGSEPRSYQISTFLGLAITTVAIAMETRQMKPMLEADFHGRNGGAGELSALRCMLAAAAELATPNHEEWRIATWQGRVAFGREVVRIYLELATGAVSEAWRAFKMLEHIASGRFAVAWPRSAVVAKRARARRDLRLARTERKSGMLELAPQTILRGIFGQHVSAKASIATDKRQLVPMIRLRLAAPQPRRATTALVHMLQAAIEAMRWHDDKWDLHVTWTDDLSAIVSIALCDGTPSEAARVMRILEAVVQAGA